ncbi:Hypothetical protein R9X50_00285100 [Acrodontium crateriforme]|uniref:FAD-binding domain-containing protein n=1 Tax=Acrodontium crateriforme TaxID=150365 RepID=A0AAQ3RBC1_9PEZI|nr:Hypothetical protein R9X50_00285100 [Acrodontium crateriforme]
MKIVILGGGISGLAFYLYLQKEGLTQTHDITIYDSRDLSSTALNQPLNLTGTASNIGDSNTDYTAPIYDASKIGGALGLAANGLGVLRRLDRVLLDEVMRTGHVTKIWRLANARGWTLSLIRMVGEDEGVMLLREELWRVLRKRVPDEVVRRGKVVRIDLKGEGARTRVRFEDGQDVEADLVVGADGIWSPTRKAMFEGQGPNGEYQFAPHYEGLVGVGGYLPASQIHNVPDGQMNVVFGKNGFFGYGYASSVPEDPSKHGDIAVWWSTHSLKECPSDWRNIDLDEVNQDLKARHKDWNDKTVQNIIKSANVPHLWPTFTTPLLPSWSCPGAVLIGDAAHALTPSSSQGASMALEDSETLALLLAHHLGKSGADGTSLALKQYDELRIPRLDMIHKKSQETSSMKQDMNVMEEFIMYFFIWLMGYLRANEKYQKAVQSYDVRKEVEKILAKH